MNEQSAGQSTNPAGAPQGQQAPGHQSGPRVSGDQMRDVNRLRRSRTDRYIAGVAGGLGRHFDIDPTVIRVVLAVLTFFGGAGILVYGVVWLCVPEEGAERAHVDLGADVLRIVLVVTGAISLMIVFGTPFFGNNWGFAFPVPLLVIGLVVLAIFAARDQRRRGGPPPPPPWGSAPTAYSPAPSTSSASATGPSVGPTVSAPTPSSPAPGPQEGTPMSTTQTDPATWSTDYSPTQSGYAPGQQPPAWMPPTASAYVPPPPRPRRTGLVLFWPTLALIAIGLGTLGIVDINTHVPVSAYAALAVAVTAVMLLVGAFVARPGGLIALGLVSCLALAITGGIDAATDGHTSSRTLNATPASAALVRDSYRIPNGNLNLDLSGVTDVAALNGRTIEARLNAGDLEVVLPPGVNAIVNAEMHVAGDIDIDGYHRSGWDKSLTRTVIGSTAVNAPTIHLNLDARVGQIAVDAN